MLASLPLVGPRLSAVCLAAALSAPLAAQCDFDWQANLPISGTNNRINGVASVPGQGLYVAGMFDAAGSTFAEHVAMWNGSDWLPLGAGVNRSATAIVAEPNGDIIVGGFFDEAGGVAANHLARWDGSAWSEFGGGADSVVTCLTRMPNGNLIAGGVFSTIGGQSAKGIAIYDGTTWTQVGTGIDNGEVRAVHVRPNGDIVVAGTFTMAGGVNTGQVAIWDGNQWISPGIFGFGRVTALAEAANGDLLMGGYVLNGTSNKMARWDGASLQFLDPPGSQMQVRTIFVEPSGAILVGLAIELGLGSPGTLYRFENGTWTQLVRDPHVLSLTMHEGNLIAAGGFIGSVVNPTILEYDGTTFRALGDAFTARMEGVVAAPDGGVFVRGVFDAIGNDNNPFVAHWDGATFTSLGTGVDGAVADMTVTPNGDLFVTGEFTLAGGTPASRVASWNGSNWTTLGAGVPEAAFEIEALRSGEVVGVFPDAPQVRVWDGVMWNPLPPAPVAWLWSSIAEFDNGVLAFGAGPEGLWTWDGNQWTQVTTEYAREIAIAPDGDLYFSGLGTISVWDGNSITALGAGFAAAEDLLVLPDGSLLASGSVNFSGERQNIMRWNGVDWVPVDGGTGILLSGTMSVREMAFTAAGELCCAGSFGSIGDVVTQNISLAVPTCPASTTVVGAGCTGASGPVSMSAKNLPWLGATFEAETTGMASAALAVQAIGTVPGIAPLPLGAPGCWLYVTPAQLLAAVPSGGTVTTGFDIPNSAALIGATFRSQTVGVELGLLSQIDQLTSSNALDLTIGAL